MSREHTPRYVKVEDEVTNKANVYKEETVFYDLDEISYEELREKMLRYDCKFLTQEELMAEEI